MIAAITGAVVLVATRERWLPRKAAPAPVASRPAAPEAVAALGRLVPAGDIRVLAAPLSGMGGTPRITELHVAEGQRVEAGQLLARFDNGPGERAENLLLRTRITNLERRLVVERRELDVKGHCQDILTLSTQLDEAQTECAYSFACLDKLCVTLAEQV